MRHISATDLAKLAKCERQMYLNALHGERIELTQRFIERGNYEHEQFRLMIMGKKGSWLIRLLRWLFRLFTR